MSSAPKAYKKAADSLESAAFFSSGGWIRTIGLRVMSRALRMLPFGFRAGLCALPDDLRLLGA